MLINVLSFPLPFIHVYLYFFLSMIIKNVHILIEHLLLLSNRCVSTLHSEQW